MSRLAYVLMMMWLAGLALGLPAGMVTHGAKAGLKGVRALDESDNGVNAQKAKNGTFAANCNCNACTCNLDGLYDYCCHRCCR